jgi:hypothetical protein
LCRKNTNSKHQISNKSQIPIFNDQNLSRQVCFRRIGYSNFGHWDLFDIWNFNKALKFQQSKSPLGLTKAGPSGLGSLLEAINCLNGVALGPKPAFGYLPQ